MKYIFHSEAAKELPDIRRMVVDRFLYKIIYMLQDGYVVILAVRMPAYWKKRIQE
jgi:hypothetical protein